MKIGTLLTKIVVITMMIAIGLLGTYIANVINNNNPLIPRGILGLLIIYLAYRNGLLPIGKEPINALFIFPRNIKYFFYAFVGALVFYWAFQQIFYMIVMRK